MKVQQQVASPTSDIVVCTLALLVICGLMGKGVHALWDKDGAASFKNIGKKAQMKT